jgi:hypothetical protein
MRLTRQRKHACGNLESTDTVRPLYEAMVSL